MIKRIIAIASALIASFIIPFIIFYVASKTDFEFQTLGFIFVIPAGSLIIGFLAGAAYVYPLKMLNIKINKVDFLFVVLFSLLVATNTYYWYYSSTYISDDGKIVYSSENATPISQYILKSNNEPVNFINYMALTIESRQISFFYKNVPTKPLVTTPENPTIGWANFIIEVLGYMVGALVSIPIIISVAFCEKCKVYYNTSCLLTRSIEDADQIVEELDKAIKSGSNLVDFFKLKQGSSGKINMLFESTSCPGCGNGMFIAKVAIKNKDGQYRNVDDLSQYLVTKNAQVVQGNFQGIELLKVLKQYSLDNAKK